MKTKSTVLFILASTIIGANAAITMTKATSDFTNFYNGDQIYDGATYVNDWSSAGGAVNPTLTGTSLALATPENNGWIQQTSGDFVDIASNQSYTLNATITLEAGQGLVLWSDPAELDGTIVYIHDSGIGTGAGLTDYDASSNVGTHSYRLAYDASGASNVFSLWRDSVLVQDASISPSNPGGGPRLIVGDCCSSFATTGFTAENISYDTSGAYAPVPEPSGVALLGLGGIALVLRRRRS